MKNTKKAGITIIALILIALVTTVISVSVNLNSDKNEPSISNAESYRPTKESPTSTVKTTPNNKPAISITAEEREMLARLVFLESSICSDDCQRAVASVVFNRLDSGRWRKDVNKDGEITLYDIIYYPNAFTPAGKIATTTPNQAAYDAVDYVLAHGITVPTYVRYFRTDYDFNWEGYENYTVIDNVYFGYFTDWENGAW